MVTKTPSELGHLRTTSFNMTKRVGIYVIGKAPHEERALAGMTPDCRIMNTSCRLVASGSCEGR